MTSSAENITYSVQERHTDCLIYDERHLTDMITEFEHLPVVSDYDDVFCERADYETNYTAKQLLVICEYYGIQKVVKNGKPHRVTRKEDMIDAITAFEGDASNRETTRQRKQMWFYMEQIKSDKFLKRFLIW